LHLQFLLQIKIVFTSLYTVDLSLSTEVSEPKTDCSNKARRAEQGIFRLGLRGCRMRLFDEAGQEARFTEGYPKVSCEDVLVSVSCKEEKLQ
jgi:hypothetical protein